MADYRWESGAVSIDLSAGQAKQYDGEIADGVLVATDTLINIHEVRGTNFGDRWIGSDNGGSDIWFRGVDNVQSFSGGKLAMIGLMAAAVSTRPRIGLTRQR